VRGGGRTTGFATTRGLFFQIKKTYIFLKAANPIFCDTLLKQTKIPKKNLHDIKKVIFLHSGIRICLIFVFPHFP